MNEILNAALLQQVLDKGKKKNVNWALISIITSILIAITTIYFSYFYKPQTIIDIELRDEMLLTKPVELDGLQSKYTYNDSIEVASLWRVTYILRNKGGKTIYGEGFSDKSIRNNYIPILLDSCDRLVSVNITNENASAKLLEQSQLYINQWRPNEYVEITILSDGENAPRLTLSDRDIVDGKITYSHYSLDENIENAPIAEYLPSELEVIIMWVYFVFMGVSIISLLLAIFTQSAGKNAKSNSATIIGSFIALLILLLPLLWIIKI